MLSAYVMHALSYQLTWCDNSPLLYVQLVFIYVFSRSCKKKSIFEEVKKVKSELCEFGAIAYIVISLCFFVLILILICKFND